MQSYYSRICGIKVEILRLRRHFPQEGTTGVLCVQRLVSPIGGDVTALAVTKGAICGIRYKVCNHIIAAYAALKLRFFGCAAE